MNKVLRTLIIVLSVFEVGYIFVYYAVPWKQLKYVNADPLYNVRNDPEHANSTGNSSVGCKIRVLNPFDSQLAKLISHPRGIVCKQLQPYMSFIDEQNNLVLNKTEFVQLKLLNPINYNCTFAPFDRGNSTDDNSYDIHKYVPIYVGEKKVIPTHQVFVNCTYANSTLSYTNLHALVPDRKVRKRQSDLELSVLLIMIDSVSSPMFDRSLPSTGEFLRSTMKFHRLRGNNRVGMNSLPNLGPMFTGKRYTNVSADMQTEQGDLPGYRYDDWPLIWKNFSVKGYLTAYVEDRPYYSLFNYLAKGFLKPPTDHYYRPWQIAITKSPLYDNSSSYCIGNDPQPFQFYDLVERLVSQYQDSPYFIMAINNQPSHDYPTDLERLDDTILNFFKRQHTLNRLNHTVVVLYGDHGPRWGSIRSTLVGRIEENLPFYSLWFPEWFYRKFPHILRNLRENEMTLTTAFDAYETLIDISQQNFNCSRKSKSKQSLRGISQICRLPKSRSCYEAGVPYFYCVCDSENATALNDTTIKIATKAIMSTIETSLQNYRNFCAPLELKSVTNVEVLQLKTGSSEEMFIMVTMAFTLAPCGGEFEVSFNLVDDNKSLDLPVSQFVRTNLYGTQSQCITEREQKYFCCCYNYMNTTKETWKR